MDIGGRLGDIDGHVNALGNGAAGGRRRIVLSVDSVPMTNPNGPEHHGHRHDEHDGSLDERLPHGTVPSCSPQEFLYADPGVLAAVLPSIEARVLGGLRRRGVDPETARDAMQDALVQLYRTRPTFRGPAGLARWLSLVAYRASEKATERTAKATGPTITSYGEVRDAAQVVESRLAFEAATHELRALRPKDRDIIESSLRDGEDGEDMVPKTEEERQRRRVRLHRARQRLRNRIRDWLVGVPALRFLPSLEVPASTGLGMFAALVSVVVVAVGGSVTRTDAHADSSPATVVAAVVVAERAADPSSPMTPPAHIASTGKSSVARNDHDKQKPTAPQAASDGRIVVRSPVPGSQTAAGTDGRHEEDRSLICYGNFPMIPDRCVDHPLAGGDPIASLSE